MKICQPFFNWYLQTCLSTCCRFKQYLSDENWQRTVILHAPQCLFQQSSDLVPRGTLLAIKLEDLKDLSVCLHFVKVLSWQWKTKSPIPTESSATMTRRWILPIWENTLPEWETRTIIVNMPSCAALQLHQNRCALNKPKVWTQTWHLHRFLELNISHCKPRRTTICNGESSQAPWGLSRQEMGEAASIANWIVSWPCASALLP